MKKYKNIDKQTMNTKHNMKLIKARTQRQKHEMNKQHKTKTINNKNTKTNNIKPTTNN